MATGSKRQKTTRVASDGDVMTTRQSQFVKEYLIDLNATAAALRAGYAKTRAGVTGCGLLQRPHVARAIRYAMEQRSQRTEITQDRVLQELARLAFFDLRKLYREDGSLKPVTELDDDSAAVVCSIEVTEVAGGMAVHDSDGEVRHVPMYTKKVKIPDKNGSLALAMRHLGMLKDKVEHSGSIEAPTLNLFLNGSKPSPKTK